MPPNHTPPERPAPEFRVYVLRLQDRVWDESKRFRDANPNFRKGKPVAYVGSTGKSIEARIADHLSGGRTSNSFVFRYYKRKMTREYSGIRPRATRRAIERREAAKAEELRSRGWGVWVGKPDTSGIGVPATPSQSESTG